MKGILMETALQFVTAAGALGSTAMLGLVGVQLGRIRSELRRVRVDTAAGQVGSGHPSAVSPAGHAIYVYRNAQWELEADFSKPGFEPSAPTIPGAYEGQAIKKQSIAKCDRIDTGALA